MTSDFHNKLWDWGRACFYLAKLLNCTTKHWVLQLDKLDRRFITTNWSLGFFFNARGSAKCQMSLNITTWTLLILLQDLSELKVWGWSISSFQWQWCFTTVIPGDSSPFQLLGIFFQWQNEFHCCVIITVCTDSCSFTSLIEFAVRLALFLPRLKTNLKIEDGQFHHSRDSNALPLSFRD